MLKTTIIGVPTALTPYPFPSLFFLLASFSECSLHGPHKINATGPDEFFTCATRLEGTCKFSYRLGYCFQLKNFTVPRVACKERADPCKFLAVQKFVKGVIVLTRVGTFSIILIIDRSRTPGSLQPLSSFLFTGAAVKEVTSPISLRFVTGFVKNTLIMVFNISRITFTVLTFRVIVKVLP